MIIQALRIFVWLTVVTGVIYPVIVTIIANELMHDQAEGSLIMKDGKVVGSKLIGQKFEQDRYFWPRPSAHDYDALASGGSNLAPTSAEFTNKVKEREQRFKTAEVQSIPTELLYTSGSGLDPHITLKAALFQIERIAKARGIEQDVLYELVRKATQKRRFLLFGVLHVNVLLLNLELDVYGNGR